MPKKRKRSNLRKTFDRLSEVDIMLEYSQAPDSGSLQVRSLVTRESRRVGAELEADVQP